MEKKSTTMTMWKRKISINCTIASADTSQKMNAEEHSSSTTTTWQKHVNGSLMKARKKKRRISKSSKKSTVILAEAEITSNFQERNIKGPGEIATK
jgi:hypothetical protein